MSALSALFFLGLTACVLCETCPEVEKVYPCTCINHPKKGFEFFIAIICKDDTMSLEEFKGVVDGLTEKKNISYSLIGLNLGEVPSKFFNGTDVKMIFFTKCNLVSLADDVHEPAFIGLEDSLQVLQIDRCFTKTTVPARLNIAHLRKLQRLLLFTNPALEIDNDWFDGLPASLERIFLWKNGIKSFGDRAFAKLTNLETLIIMEENHTGHIQRSMFPFPADRLEFLSFESLNVSRIPEDIFSNMSALKAVEFSDMGISRLEQKTWEPVLENLEEIYLKDNPLVCDSHMDWMHEFDVTDFLYGTCRYPEEKNGTTLWTFLNDEER